MVRGLDTAVRLCGVPPEPPHSRLRAAAEHISESQESWIQALALTYRLCDPEQITQITSSLPLFATLFPLL